MQWLSRSSRARIRRRRATGEGGFTLLEMVAALTVLSIGVLATTQVFLGSLKTAGLGEARTQATAIATREVEALRAVPYATLGFAAGTTSAQFEGADTVFVTGGTAVATSGPEVVDGQPFGIARYIVWAANGSTPHAYKRVVSVVSWSDEAGTHTVRQDDAVYPGGLGPVASTTTAPTTTTPGSPGAPSGLIAVGNAQQPTQQID